MNPTAHSRGPSPLLPLAYLAAAALAFVLAAASVPWLAFELAGHYYQPRLLALTHVVTLGWITLTIMGAAYQILPIVLGRPVWSERLARWQLVLTAVGIVGMVGHFFVGSWPGFLWAAGLVTVGVGAHLANAAFTAHDLHDGGTAAGPGHRVQVDRVHVVPVAWLVSRICTVSPSRTRSNYLF